MAIIERSFIKKYGKRVNASFYNVTIEGQGAKIQGQMKTGFAYQIQAKWGDLFTGLIPGAELLQKTGDASLTTGIFSRKYYQGGGNLQMPVEFRIYEHDDDIVSTGGNRVLTASRTLAHLTVPNGLAPGAIEAGINKIGTGIKQTGENILSVVTGESTAGQALGEQIKVIRRLTDAGRTLTLTIGDFFRCSQMVIESINVTYSKELTHTGPLYGDFQVGLLSLESIVRGGGALGVEEIFSNPMENITINGKNLRTPSVTFPAGQQAQANSG